MEDSEGVILLEMTLNKKWFDMIYSGEKTSEYRIPKKYWLNRVFKKEFVESGEWEKYHHQFLDVPKKYWKKQFTHIRFKNGYSKNSPVMVVHLCSISFDTGDESCGAIDGETYLTFSLGKVAAACL